MTDTTYTIDKDTRSIILTTVDALELFILDSMAESSSKGIHLSLTKTADRQYRIEMRVSGYDKSTNGDLQSKGDMR